MKSGKRSWKMAHVHASSKYLNDSNLCLVCDKFLGWYSLKQVTDKLVIVTLHNIVEVLLVYVVET